VLVERINRPWFELPVEVLSELALSAVGLHVNLAVLAVLRVARPRPTLYLLSERPHLLVQIVCEALSGESAGLGGLEAVVVLLDEGALPLRSEEIDVLHEGVVAQSRAQGLCSFLLRTQVLLSILH
jgi:hypothetical protein